MHITTKKSLLFALCKIVEVLRWFISIFCSLDIINMSGFSAKSDCPRKELSVPMLEMFLALIQYSLVPGEGLLLSVVLENLSQVV